MNKEYVHSPITSNRRRQAVTYRCSVTVTQNAKTYTAAELTAQTRRNISTLYNNDFTYAYGSDADNTSANRPLAKPSYAQYVMYENINISAYHCYCTARRSLRNCSPEVVAPIRHNRALTVYTNANAVRRGLEQYNHTAAPPSCCPMRQTLASVAQSWMWNAPERCAYSTPGRRLCLKFCRCRRPVQRCCVMARGAICLSHQSAGCTAVASLQSPSAPYGTAQTYPHSAASSGADWAIFYRVRLTRRRRCPLVRPSNSSGPISRGRCTRRRLLDRQYGGGAKAFSGAVWRLNSAVCWWSSGGIWCARAPRHMSGRRG